MFMNIGGDIGMAKTFWEVSKGEAWKGTDA